MPITTSHPNGHFYSPVVDPEELSNRLDELWPTSPQILGIDFDDVSHLNVLQNHFPQFIGEFDYAELAPAEDATLDRFYIQNSQFSWLDARALFVLLRAWQPKRVIEVGSGYSSLLMADVNQRFLGGACEITCIEPYPRQFLRNGIPGLTRVIEAKVQEVPFAKFDELKAGDVLFIDSSHVAKTGSDVNHLFFEILPRLKSGVRIHIHDIHLPREYPKEWVINENRSWNEQYLLRALLMYSTGFRVLFGCNYAFTRFPEEVRTALNLTNGAGWGGGSMWIDRV